MQEAQVRTGSFQTFAGRLAAAPDNSALLSPLTGYTINGRSKAAALATREVMYASLLHVRDRANKRMSS
jgi:hypothetical protein